MSKPQLEPRSLSDWTILDNHNKHEHITTCDEIHFNASHLPCETTLYDDGISSSHFLDKEDGTYINCNRQVIWQALGIKSHPDVTKAIGQLRNMERGNTCEWRELTYINKAIKEQYPDCRMVFQSELFGEPPKELQLPLIDFYGIKVSGRCDAIVYQKDKLLFTIEMKSPRANSFKPMFGGDKPKTGYLLQDNYYNYVFNTLENRQDVYGWNYIVNDGCSEFGEWKMDICYQDGKPLFMRAQNKKEELRLAWSRLENGVKRAVEYIKIFEPLLKEEITPERKLELLQKIPAEPIEGKLIDTCVNKRKKLKAYPCIWDEGATMCDFYPYCYHNNKKGL